MGPRSSALQPAIRHSKSGRGSHVAGVRLGPSPPWLVKPADRADSMARVGRGLYLPAEGGGARPLGGLEHRAGATFGQPKPNRPGARNGAGRPAIVLPLTSQYRQ